jgi:hypothetical protein
VTGLRCWQCGIEPADTIEASTLCGDNRIIPRWPIGGDHPHALTPPTPDDLVVAGHAALKRVTEAWSQ